MQIQIDFRSGNDPAKGLVCEALFRVAHVSLQFPNIPVDTPDREVVISETLKQLAPIIITGSGKRYVCSENVFFVRCKFNRPMQLWITCSLDVGVVVAPNRFKGLFEVAGLYVKKRIIERCDVSPIGHVPPIFDIPVCGRDAFLRETRRKFWSHRRLRKHIADVRGKLCDTCVGALAQPIDEDTT